MCLSHIPVALRARALWRATIGEIFEKKVPTEIAGLS
jgi:hypothetical protein